MPTPPDGGSFARYLTPVILLSFAALWSYSPLAAIISLDSPISEWPFFDYRVASGFVWPIVFAILHTGCAVVHFYRERAPRLPFISYTCLLAILACVAAYYFFAHGFAVSTNPLPYVLALNLPPLAFIINWAWQSRRVGNPA